MKKENVIVIFYVLYFTWLFTVAFLTPSVMILNYYTVFVTIFYFLFLRQPGDFFWFWFSAIVPFVFAIASYSSWQFNFDITAVKYVPLWLPLAWGTTVVALRKFYIMMVNR